MQAYHLSTIREIMQAPEAFDLKCWTKSGAILEAHNAVALRYA